MNATRTIGATAAIDAIRRRSAFRVHAETPALRLLGVEDKYAARILWRERIGKPVLDTELSTLEAARNEIQRRSKSEIEAAKEEFKRRNKIWSYFPDEGPFRRELYPRHMEFVDATRTDDEVGILAANRCLTPWTPVETDRGERLALELIGETGFGVRSWDGNYRCTKPASPVFLVGIEPAFQIHLDNGEVFSCSNRHRVLRYGSTDGHRHSDWVSIGQQIRALNGLHLNRTAQGWTASYVSGARLYGEPLPAPSVSYDGIPPRRSGAPSNNQQRRPSDEVASRFGYSHACQAFGHSSSSHAQNRLVDLIDRTEAPCALRFSIPKILRDRLSRKSHNGSSLDLRALVADLQPLLSSQPCVDEFLLALDSPLLFNGRSIVAVVPLGLQPIIDFTVPETHNYFAAGAVHHNTGKTQLGALCVSHWATGRYPHWWNGRVFDGPTTGWVMNKTAKDCRDINEAELLGPPGNDAERGTGMIPGHLIQKVTPKPGTPHAFEFIAVEHVSGATSYIQTKSYDQGREAYQGRAISYGWADEEISLELWDECRLRTMTTGGLLIFSYTPVNGLTEMTMNFMESAGYSIEAMRHNMDAHGGEE